MKDGAKISTNQFSTYEYDEAHVRCVVCIVLHDVLALSICSVMQPKLIGAQYDHEGNTMDWIPLIASTARLIDLHDSHRESGRSTSQYDLYREARGGNHDGLWLDVALTVIEYLRERESEVVGGFVSGTEVRESLQKRITNLSDEDVKFVLSALTTPAEIWFVERMDNGTRPINSTKETNLIERSRTADAYRLASTGRTAAGLAANVRDIAYIAGSAKNLLTAIKARDFWKITELAAAIIDVLRTFRLEIESHREGSQKAGIQGFFKERGDVIKEQIEDAAKILVEANEFLSLQSTRAEFQIWIAAMDRAGKPSFGHGYAKEHLKNVTGQTLKLLESFTQLVNESLTMDESALSPVSFIDLSASLAAKSFQDSFYFSLISSFGPTRLRQIMPCPFDFFGVVEPQRGIDNREEDEDSEGIEDAGIKGIGFIAEHGSAILAELRKGPLTLTDALEREWIGLGTDTSNLSELVGTYCDPTMLGEDLNIVVRFGDGRATYAAEGIGRLSFDELVMVLESK